MFTLGNISCKKNEKIRSFWNIAGYEIPVTIINGEKEGKILGISSGIHACEYNGIQTAIEIANELEPKDICGTVVILHPVNYSGFFKRTPEILPEDEKNLNRVFPGNLDGTLSEKIAYYLSNELYPKLDFFIDMHGGDTYEYVMPFIYAPGLGDEKVIQRSHDLANALDLEFRVRSKSSTGAYNSCAIQGTPAILIEVGGMGIWSKEEVNLYKKNIKLALEFLNIIKKQEAFNKKITQTEIVTATYLNAKDNIFWYPNFKSGEKFIEGSILGITKDCFGNLIEDIKAKYNGVILYQTVSLAVPKDKPLIAYGKI